MASQPPAPNPKVLALNAALTYFKGLEAAHHTAHPRALPLLWTEGHIHAIPRKEADEKDKQYRFLKLMPALGRCAEAAELFLGPEPYFQRSNNATAPDKGSVREATERECQEIVDCYAAQEQAEDKGTKLMQPHQLIGLLKDGSKSGQAALCVKGSAALRHCETFIGDTAREMARETPLQEINRGLFFGYLETFSNKPVLTMYALAQILAITVEYRRLRGLPPHWKPTPLPPPHTHQTPVPQQGESHPVEDTATLNALLAARGASQARSPHRGGSGHQTHDAIYISSGDERSPERIHASSPKRPYRDRTPVQGPGDVPGSGDRRSRSPGPRRSSSRSRQTLPQRRSSHSAQAQPVPSHADPGASSEIAVQAANALPHTDLHRPAEDGGHDWEPEDYSWLTSQRFSLGRRQRRHYPDVSNAQLRARWSGAL